MVNLNVFIADALLIAIPAMNVDIILTIVLITLSISETTILLFIIASIDMIIRLFSKDVSNLIHFVRGDKNENVKICIKKTYQ